MIVLARTIDAKARDVRKRYENEITGVERANYAKIARARFDSEGTKLIVSFTPEQHEIINRAVEAYRTRPEVCEVAESESDQAECLVAICKE